LPRAKKKTLRGSVTQNFAESDYNRPLSPELKLLLRFALLLAAIGFVAGSAFLVWYKKWPQQAVHYVEDSTLSLTKEADFVVRDVVVEGRRHTDKGELMAALGLIAGSPTLGFDPDTALARIEKLPWVAHATVLRRLPDVVVVKLIEREPTARWQHAGKTVIIDREGKELPQVRIEDFDGLPLVIGDDAPREAEALLGALKSFPAVSALVTSAVRVSERRWNLYLKPKVLVKLPEKGIEGALQRLTQLVVEQKVLERDVVAVDLRLPDRLYLESGTRPPSKE
jgi:cell division protein FtsQ